MTNMTQMQAIPSPELEPESLWNKVKDVAKEAGRQVIGLVLTLYYCLVDKDTPEWAKATIIGALIYFISPVDAIPDVLPFVGYSDDLVVLAAAMGTVAAHVKPEHRLRANDWVEGVFGKD